MSKTVSNKESDIFKRARSSQKQKNEPTTENEEEASIAAVLTELKTLRAEFSGFGSKLDGIDGRLCKMANTVEALENNMNEVKQDLASNIARMEEAKTRIVSTEDKLETTAADNRWKNLRMFGLREGEEGNRQMLDYVQEMLPGWLGTDKSIMLERAHRTLGPAKPNQDRAVLIRFLKFQDREFTFRCSKMRDIKHNGNKLSFAQDFSAETMRQRLEFNAVKKLFLDAGSFRGFQQNPCRIRILHNGQIHLFSSPEDVEKFHRGL
ncbi:putative LINE-1 type transposase domain-containing protein 1-like [Triplophysa rosa]|uniref:LINE-1 type transposase domain-containing protein 1-like n=1 Tax=Triplophysa rosa TaxID=992332 RepID=A0A9W7T3W6_TRIRA|nr:putative LINE-1 type transposase domain-containing protein 1-like [Triplophysa rosa]